MASLNKTMIIGRLGKDPELRFFSFLKANQYGHYIDMELEWNMRKEYAERTKNKE